MTKPSPEASDTSWHLDKRVPITLLLAIGLQTAGAVWWASGISERVSTLERGDQGRAAQATQLNCCKRKPDANPSKTALPSCLDA